MFSQAYYRDIGILFSFPILILSIENKKVCNSYQKYIIITVFLLTFVLHAFIQKISSFQSSRSCRFPEYSAGFPAITPLCFPFPLLAKEIPLIPLMTMMPFIFPFSPTSPYQMLIFQVTTSIYFPI